MFSLSEGSKLGIPVWFPAWLRERIVPGIWWLVPLSFVISLAGGHYFWFVRAMIAMLALILFRLLDDLEDIAHDRLRHPQRVLCQCKPASLSRVHGFCVAGLTILCLFIAAVGDRWISFVAGLVVVVIGSRVRQRMNDSALRVVFAHVILLKVPALVISLTQGEVAPNILWGRALGLAGFVGAYEVVHDAESRRSSWAPLVLAIDMVCLVWGLVKSIIEETSA